MAKSYKKKHEKVEDIVENDAISKKEQYDLEKKKKLAEKEKEQKKKNLKKKIVKKSKQTNLGARLFAICMLILMIGSVVISALAHVFG